jgi:hypothetical protein
MLGEPETPLAEHHPELKRLHPKFAADNLRRARL